MQTPYPPCVPPEDYPLGIVEALRGVEKALKESEDMLDYLIRKLPEEDALIVGVFRRQLLNIQAMGSVAHNSADILEENFIAQREERERLAKNG
jgi:hypothetical protein